jgi:hypothetical protein
MKSAVFCCQGLGDGLVSLVISQNLYLNGICVDTFHPKSLSELQAWFPKLPIKPFPSEDEIPALLAEYDRIFVSYDESSSFIMELILQGKAFEQTQLQRQLQTHGHEQEKKNFKKKIFVLNPCPSRKIGHQPYFSDAKFSPNSSVVENFSSFCEKILLLPKITKENGIVPPKDEQIPMQFQKEKKRIILHPASAKESKNWPIEKYLKLAKKLQKKGFSPCFVVHEKERKKYLFVEEHKIPLISFSSLEDLAHFVYESGAFIGNDSGIGHLASCLNLPTISIFRNHRSAKLWHPGWGKNQSVFPPAWILNIGGFRFRDKYWKKCISVKKVFKEFTE